MKSAVVFLRETGIRLIIYLDVLLILSNLKYSIESARVHQGLISDVWSDRQQQDKPVQKEGYVSRPGNISDNNGSDTNQTADNMSPWTLLSTVCQAIIIFQGGGISTETGNLCKYENWSKTGNPSSMQIGQTRGSEINMLTLP